MIFKNLYLILIRTFQEPFYMGIRQKRIKDARYDELLDNFMRAIVRRWVAFLLALSISLYFFLSLSLNKLQCLVSDISFVKI